MPGSFSDLRLKLTSFFASNPAKLAVLLILVLSVPLAVLVAQQEQDNRQRASETPVTPPSIGNQILWATEHVAVQADDFYFIADGTKYVVNPTTTKLESSARYDTPQSGAGFLDVEWTEENGDVSKVSINLELINNQWSVYSITTRSGPLNAQKSVNYLGFPGGPAGVPLEQQIFDLTSRPESSVTGSIHFENFKMIAFTSQPTPTSAPTSTPTPTLTPTMTPTPTFTPTPTATLTPAPTVTPVPSAEPTPSQEQCDLDGNKKVNERDLYVLLGCYSDTSAPKNCTQSKFSRSDLNGDKKVNQVDYNIFIRSCSITVVTPTPKPVVDKTAPDLRIAAPRSRVVRGNSKLAINATASDKSGIAKLEFLVNGKELCVDSGEPYSCVWNVPQGRFKTYLLTVKAYDTAGNITTRSRRVWSLF